MDPETDSGESLAGSVEADASVLLDDEGNPVAAIVELPEGEELAAPVSDAVAIAEIEANREITIAALHVDAAIASTEAHTEIETARLEVENERETLWQNDLSQLRTSIAELEARIMELSAVLAPPLNPIASPEVEELLAIVEPETLTPQSMSDPMPEIVTEVTLSERVESPAEVISAIIAPEKRRRRLI